MGWQRHTLVWLGLVLAGCGRVEFQAVDAASHDAAQPDGGGSEDAGADAGPDGGPRCDYAALVRSFGPRGYWRLGDSDTVAVDSSGNGYDGAYTGGGTHVAGAIAGDPDTALELDGIDDWVNLMPNGPIDIASSIPAATLMAWTRTTVIPQGGTALLPNFVPILGARGIDPMLARAFLGLVQRDELWVLGRTDDTVTTGVQQLVTTTNFYPLDGAWHFVVGEIDYAGDRYRTWIDGVPDESLAVAFTGTTTQPELATSAFIGGSVPYDSWFQGTIDEVAFFDRTLTDADIAALFDCAQN